MTAPKLKQPELLLLTAAAALTRFWHLFTPNQTVFDEVYFKAFALNYLKGSYFFDIHPPLGKVLLAGWARLLGLSGATSFSDPHVAMRILPALAGTLLIPIFYIFLRQLKVGRRVATLGATLLLLENALLVESRFILVDSLLILFGLSAIVAWLAARKRQGWQAWAFYALGAVLAGAAASTKLSGLTAFGVIGLIWYTDLLRSRKYRQGAMQFIVLIGLAFAVFAGSFWVHFRLLPNSGDGDAFMSQKYQSTLKNSPHFDSRAQMSFPAKFTELNKAMWQANESLKTASHPYASKWYTWPVETRPIYYWTESGADGAVSNIYLLGNPVIWWGIIVAFVATSTAVVIDDKLRKKIAKRYFWPIGLLAAAFLANWLPFILIARVMFLYHYFFALIFSLALVVLLLGATFKWDEKPASASWDLSKFPYRNLYFAIIIAALTGFIYFAPISYGWFIQPDQFQQRMWLRSWR